MPTLRALAPAAILAVLAASPAAAQPVPDDVPGPDWLRLQMRTWVRADTTWPLVDQGMLALYHASAPGPVGITAASREAAERRHDAQQRAMLMQPWLAQDLDNDGVVTREEAEANLRPRADQPMTSNGVRVMPTPDQVAVVLGRLVEEALRADANRDGSIDFAEARAFADGTHRERKAANRSTVMTVPMSLDENGDGTLTRDEYRAAVRRLFQEIDTDGDDRFSEAEAQAARTRLDDVQRAAALAAEGRRREAEQAERMRACGLAEPQAGTRLVVLGVYEGQALSTVGLGGDDEAVTTAQVTIEPGPEPLHLVLASYDAQIWQVGGAIERVRGVTAFAERSGPEGMPRVGVTGVPRERVAIARKATCLNAFWEHPATGSVKALAALRAHTRRDPDAIVAAYGAARVFLPSGRLEEKPALTNAVALPTSGPAAGVWREMLRFNPAGLVRIDPAEVVSLLPARRYEVLPQQAGLAQLVEEGALRVAGHQRGLALDGGRRPEVVDFPREFLIQRKIRFPAGLYGAHSVRFILGRGVPLPDGSPGHSDVISEETGQPVPLDSRLGR